MEQQRLADHQEDHQEEATKTMTTTGGEEQPGETPTTVPITATSADADATATATATVSSDEKKEEKEAVASTEMRQDVDAAVGGEDALTETETVSRTTTDTIAIAIASNGASIMEDNKEVKEKAEGEQGQEDCAPPHTGSSYSTGAAVEPSTATATATADAATMSKNDTIVQELVVAESSTASSPAGDSVEASTPIKVTCSEETTATETTTTTLAASVTLVPVPVENSESLPLTHSNDSNKTETRKEQNTPDPLDEQRALRVQDNNAAATATADAAVGPRVNGDPAGIHECAVTATATITTTIASANVATNEPETTMPPLGTTFQDEDKSTTIDTTMAAASSGSRSDSTCTVTTATTTTTVEQQRDSTIVTNTVEQEPESTRPENVATACKNDTSTVNVESTSAEPQEKKNSLTDGAAVVDASCAVEPETSIVHDSKTKASTATDGVVLHDNEKREHEPVTKVGLEQHVMNVSNKSPAATKVENVEDDPTLDAVVVEENEPIHQISETPSSVEKPKDVISAEVVVENVSDTDKSPATEPTTANEEAHGTMPSPPQTPPPIARDVDGDMRTPVVATGSETIKVDEDATPGTTPSASTVLTWSNGSVGDANRTATTDDAGSKLQSPPRLSAKTSSPQGVMDFHNIQQGEDAMYHSSPLFPINSPQRQEAHLSASTTTATMPSSGLDPKESVLPLDDEAASFLPRALHASNRVKDIYRPNEKKEETRTHGFAELAKQNSLRNKQLDDGLKVTSVTSIRKMFEKKSTSDTPMGLEAFHQQQAYRRQQSHEQKIQALAKMHGFSEEVIAEYLKKSAHGEVDYSHLAKLQDEIDKLKNHGNDMPDGLGRLEKSPHRRTRSTGEIDTSHVVDVDGVDRSDWKGPITTALSADAADATGMIHPDCKATDYRGMIFVVHHLEGLMLLQGKKEEGVRLAGAASISNTTGAHDECVPGVSADAVVGLEELHESVGLSERKFTDRDVGHEGGATASNVTGADENSVPVVSSTTAEPDSSLVMKSTGPVVGHEGEASTSNTTAVSSVSGASSNAVVELFESDSLVKNLNDIDITSAVAAETPLYQLPGGRISEEDALAAAQQSSDPQRQLLLAARAGAARQLYESTGIDVRSRLKDLVPAILKPDCDDTAESVKLPNEHNSNIFFFLNVTDDDFVKADDIEAASGVELQDVKEEPTAVADVKEGSPVVKKSDTQGERPSPTKPAGERLLLKLSNDRSGFVFEKEPARATELLKSDNTDIGVLSSEALELLTQQQQTLADQKNGTGDGSGHDKSAPFTYDRFLQRQHHPAIDSITSYRSLADAKDTFSEDRAHASEHEEMASCQGGSAGATAAAAASSSSALVDQDLQKSLDKCACCVVM